MSLNKIENPQHSNSPDIFELIEKEEAQYSEHFYVYKMYQKACSEKNQDNDYLASCIEVFLSNVKNTLESVNSLEKSLALKKEKNNKLILLKIKLMILTARIHQLPSCIGSNKKTYLEIYTNIMQEITLHEKNIIIKNNSVQKEIAYTLRIICTYGGEGEIQNYDLARWGITQWHMVKQYKDGIDKLEIYRDMSEFQGTFNIPVLKGDCYSIFETIDKEYSAKLSQHLEAYEKVEYMRACFVIFQFSIKNYHFPHKITQKLGVDKIDNFQRMYEKYIPKIQACKNIIKLEEIIENIDSLFDYQYFMSDFYECLHDELTTLKSNYDALNHTSKLKEKHFEMIVKMRQLFIEFDAFNKELNLLIKDKYTFEFFNIHFANAHTTSTFLNEEDLNKFKTEHDESQKKSEASLVEAITTSKTNANALLATTSSKKQTVTKKRNNKSQNAIKHSTNNATSKNKKKIETKPPSAKPKSEGLELLENAFMLMDEKNHLKAISTFEKARKLELTLEEKISALDGLIDAVQKNTIEALDEINLEYSFCDNKIKSTQKIISDAIKNNIYLDTLYLEFKQLVQKPESKTIKTSQSDILKGNLILRENYLKITTKIKQLQLTKDRRLAEKKWKETLKNKKVKPITFLPPKDDAFPFAYEPKYKEVPIPFNLKEVVDFLRKVKGDHYLVGSMVLQLLLKEGEEATFKPADLDFLTLNSKTEDWIRNGHFAQNTEELRLFKLQKGYEFQPFLPLEVWRVDKTKNINECLLTRDFRVSALACEFIALDDGSYKGKLIDPTGFGFEDFELRRLVMLGKAEERFKKSPSIILRVIKYLMQGFTPSQSILSAMHSWQPTEETNLSKLKGLCQKIFSNCNSLEFAKYLIQFQLQVKLFNISSDLNAEELVSVLNETLTNKYSNNNNHFFPSPKKARLETGLERLDAANSGP